MASPSVGKTCPYCQTAMKPGVPVQACPSCGIPHHQDCWSENGGCTVFGRLVRAQESIEKGFLPMGLANHVKLVRPVPKDAVVTYADVTIDESLFSHKLRRAIVVTSNRIVEDWGKYLGDNTMSTTILDRLMHRSALLAFEGKSYRLKEAASRIASASAA